MRSGVDAIFRREVPIMGNWMMKHRCGLAAAALCACLAGSAIASAADAASTPDPKQLAELVRLENSPEIRRQSTEWNKASAEAVRQHLRSVAASGDAGGLLAAAMLWQTFDGEAKAKDAASSSHSAPVQGTRAWFDAARAARPLDVRVAWIEAKDCPLLSDACDSEGALRFLLQAEPDNAAVHLMALAAADKRGDRKAADAYWRSAAQSTRFDAHMLDIGRLLHSTMRGVTWPQLPSRLAEAIGSSLGLGRPATSDDVADVGALAMATATLLPGYMQIANGCKPQAVSSVPTRESECRAIMALLAEDRSTVISQMIALPALVRLSGDTEVGKAWRERLRQLYWVYENQMYDMPLFGPGAPTPTDYMTWYMTEGELPAMERLLELRGKPVRAPAGWLPRTERYRVLVSTGRDPQA